MVLHLPVAGLAKTQAETLMGDGVKTGQHFIAVQRIPVLVGHGLLIVYFICPPAVRSQSQSMIGKEFFPPHLSQMQPHPQYADAVQGRQILRHAVQAVSLLAIGQYFAANLLCKGLICG